MPRVDQPDTPPNRDAGDGLGILQMRVHAGGGFQKPGPRQGCGFGRIAFLAGKPIGQAQGFDGPAGGAHGQVVVTGTAFGVDLAIFADVRQALGLLRVRPPVGPHAEVIVLVAAGSYAGFVHDGGFAQAQCVVCVA